MTIKNALERLNKLYPNSIEREVKINLLSELDGKIYEELLKNRSMAPESFSGYTASTEDTTELLAPFPYDDVYVKYLSMEIDLLNGDIERYNNKLALFADSYSMLASHIGRTRRSLINIKFNHGGDEL